MVYMAVYLALCIYLSLTLSVSVPPPLTLCDSLPISLSLSPLYPSLNLSLYVSLSPTLSLPLSLTLSLSLPVSLLVSPSQSHNPALTCSQCLSLMPGLHMVCRRGRFCLNLSIFPLVLSATFLGPGWSPNVLVSLYMVRNISETSLSIVSEFNWRNGPKNIKRKELTSKKIFMLS